MIDTRGSRVRLAAAFALAAGVTMSVVPPAGAAAAPLCFGRTPTVVLTNGADTYTTQAGVAEVIWAGGGGDTIWPADAGTDPGDYICGGPGADQLYGDVGPDHINGGDGADRVDGGPGADVLGGNAGDDRVTDSPIDSNLGADPDTLRGGPGDDVTISGYGHDRAYGNGGNDDLYDLECSTTALSGGSGSDYFESYQDSYGGGTCDTTDTDSPGDTVAGGADYDRALLSHADTATGVERVTRAAPQQ